MVESLRVRVNPTSDSMVNKSSYVSSRLAQHRCYGLPNTTLSTVKWLFKSLKIPVDCTVNRVFELWVKPVNNRLFLLQIIVGHSITISFSFTTNSATL